MTKTLIFDTGPVISLTLNNLLYILEPLKKRFQGDFYITDSVYSELIRRPLETRKYKFEALQILPLIKNGTIFVIKDDLIRIRAKADYLLELANHCFKARGNWISIVHPGEMTVAASALIYGSGVIAVDERTTRSLIESPYLLKHHLERKLHTPVSVNSGNLDKITGELGGLRVIRSFELAIMAFEMGLLDRYIIDYDSRLVPDARQAVLEGVLWALKLSGCSVRHEEIEETLEIEKKGLIGKG